MPKLKIYYWAKDLGFVYVLGLIGLNMYTGPPRWLGITSDVLQRYGAHLGRVCSLVDR